MTVISPQLGAGHGRDAETDAQPLASRHEVGHIFDVLPNIEADSHGNQRIDDDDRPIESGKVRLLQYLLGFYHRS